jgi:hypothetical protein
MQHDRRHDAVRQLSLDQLERLDHIMQDAEPVHVFFAVRCS